MRTLSMCLCVALAALVIAIAFDSAHADDDRKAKRQTFQYLGVTIYPMKHKTIVVNDPEASVKIKSARALLMGDQRVVMETSVSRHMRSHIPRGPLVEVELDTKNVSAAIIGVAFYDSFNEPAGGSSVFTDDLKQQPIQWESTANLAWRGFGIACVYVSVSETCERTYLES